MMMDSLVDLALAEARPVVFWLDRPEHPEPAPPLSNHLEADLVVVGGGFTGLWTAVTAAEADPGRSIVVLEADTVAFGASGRNGGFCDASLTHGLENGIAHWPGEIDTLIRLGDENLQGLLDVVARHSIDCSPEPTGALDVAVAPWQTGSLAKSAVVHEAHGRHVTLLDEAAARAEVDSRSPDPPGSDFSETRQLVRSRRPKEPKARPSGSGPTEDRWAPEMPSWQPTPSDPRCNASGTSSHRCTTTSW